MTDDMPTTYETKTTTQSSTSIGLHTEYIRTIPGILKIVEIILDIIVFICATAATYGRVGWVSFVSMSAFLTTLIYFIFYLVGLMSRLPGPWGLIEMIYYAVFTVLYLIAAIVAAALASGYPAVGAAAFFAFVATGVYAVDTFFQFRNYRNPPVTVATSQGSPVHHEEAARTGTY